MAKAWKDVIASPQYQALAPEQKAQAQEQYFNEVVAPQAGESVEQAKQAFYAAYPLPSTNEIDRSQSATQNIQHTSSDNSLASGYAKLATQQREGLERSAEQEPVLGLRCYNRRKPNDSRDGETAKCRLCPRIELTKHGCPKGWMVSTFRL